MVLLIQLAIPPEDLSRELAAVIVDLSDFAVDVNYEIRG